MIGMPNRTICHVVSRTDGKELTMRQTTRPAVRQASYLLATITLGTTMVTLLPRSVLIMHRTQHHQLKVRSFRAKVRAMLNRRRRRRRRRSSSSSSNNSSDLSSYKCPLGTTPAARNPERQILMCSQEGRPNLVSGHEGRAEASMLTLNPLFLMVGGAGVRLTTDHLSTRGCQRRGSIISSRREGEDDDDDAR